MSATITLYRRCAVHIAFVLHCGMIPDIVIHMYACCGALSWRGFFLFPKRPFPLVHHSHYLRGNKQVFLAKTSEKAIGGRGIGRMWDWCAGLACCRAEAIFQLTENVTWHYYYYLFVCAFSTACGPSSHWTMWRSTCVCTEMSILSGRTHPTLRSPSE